MATRRGVGRVSLKRAIFVAAAVVRRRRSSSSSQAWRAQRGRPGTKMVDMSTSRLGLMDGGDDCRVSIWNERNMCETSGWLWICVLMVIANLTVLSGGLFANLISDDCSRQKESDENAACRRPVKNELKHHEEVFQLWTAWNLVAKGAVHRVNARPSIERRQSEMQ